jgi:outer membrane autotransporter protein
METVNSRPGIALVMLWISTGLIPGSALALPVMNIAVDRAIATEGTLQPVRIELQLNEPAPAGGVCIDLDLVGGSARLDEDFRLAAAVPRIPEGAMSASVPILIVDDEVTETDETVLIVLKPSDCYQPGPSRQFSLLIRDDDDDANSLGGRLQQVVANVPDPLIASQLANLGQLCATNQPAPGSVLDRRCQLLRLALRDPGAAAQLLQSLRGVVGEEFSSQRRGFRMLAGSQLGALGRRLEAVRGGAGSGVALVDSGVQAGTGFLPLSAQVADDGELLGTGLGIFASAVFGDGRRDASALEDGYRSDSASFQLGIDRRFGPDWVLGLAYIHSRFDADLSEDNGDLKLNSDALNLYFSHSFGGGWIDGAIGYGRGELRQTRIARFSGQTDEESFSSVDVLRGRPDTRLLIASMSTGWDWQRGNWSLGPRASLEYSRFNVDGFAEAAVEGSDAFAVALEEQRIRSRLARLGFGSQWVISTSYGVLLPQFEAYWVGQFEDDAEVLRGYFVNDPGRRAFQLPTAGVDSRYGEASISLAMQFARGRSGFLSYRRLFGFEATEQSYWSLGLRWEL